MGLQTDRMIIKLFCIIYLLLPKKAVGKILSNTINNNPDGNGKN
jgi:hypothetical protein